MTPTAPLPLAQCAPGIHRPQLRRDCPLLWRGDERLQIGAASSAPVLDRMSADLATWLTGLDGLRTWQQVQDDLDEQATVTARDAHRIVRAAVLAGALNDAAAMPDPWRWLALGDRDRADPDLAAAALTYRNPQAANTVLARRQTTTVSVVGDGPLATELRAALAISGLVLLADEAPEASIRVLADGLHPAIVDDPDSPAHEHPHLAAGTYGDLGLIGPLVVPGSTSCLRCSHLHMRDRDPHWPSVALQLGEAIKRLGVRPLDRILTRIVATHAVLLLRRWVDDPDLTDEWANIAIEARLPSGALRRLPRPTHPLCGCRWPDAGRAA